MTYAEAHAQLQTALEARGWLVARKLKMPHATSPDGRARLWFKAQSVYYTTGPTHRLQDARSAWVDARAWVKLKGADATIKAILAWIDPAAPQSSSWPNP